MNIIYDLSDPKVKYFLLESSAEYFVTGFENKGDLKSHIETNMTNSFIIAKKIDFTIIEDLGEK